MKARISQLHKTEEEWLEFLKSYKEQNKEFIPQAGEFIVYDPDNKYNYARLKVGDGSSPLQKLPFFVDAALFNVLKASTSIDAGRINKN